MLGQLRATFGVPRRRAAPRDGRDGWTVVERSGAEPPLDPSDADVSRDLGQRRRRSPSPAARCPARTSGCSTPSPPRSAAAAERERLQREAGEAGRSRRRQHAAGVAAAGRLARPAHAAGVDQGVDLQPAPARHRLAAGDGRRVPGDDRGGDRPAHGDRRQPARHEPAAGVGAHRRAAPDRRRGDRRRRGRQPRPPTGAVEVDVPGDAARRRSPTPPCWSGRSPTSSPTPSATRPAASRCASPPARSSATAGRASTSGSIDRGPGIRPADRELVFQPFQRVVDHQADGTGVGLGLAIARGFVEAMGGELAIEDTPAAASRWSSACRWRRDS